MRDTIRGALSPAVIAGTLVLGVSAVSALEVPINIRVPCSQKVNWNGWEATLTTMCYWYQSCRIVVSGNETTIECTN